MQGLIKKDLLMIKSNTKLLGILLIIYAVMAYEGQMDLSFLLPFMSVMIMISTFSYDAYNKWDSYVITFPKGRKNSVKAKYLATILLIIITTIILSILTILIAYLKDNLIDFNNLISSLLGIVLATTLIQSLMYPAIYKFGLEKARIGLFILIFGIAIIGSILLKFLSFEVPKNLITILNTYGLILIPLIATLILFISYKISEHIFLNKEF